MTTLHTHSGVVLYYVAASREFLTSSSIHNPVDVHVDLVFEIEIFWFCAGLSFDYRISISLMPYRAASISDLGHGPFTPPTRPQLTLDGDTAQERLAAAPGDRLSPRRAEGVVAFVNNGVAQRARERGNEK